MKTVAVSGYLTYDDKLMYGEDQEAFDWFVEVLFGGDLKLMDFGELGDVIGSIKLESVDP